MATIVSKASKDMRTFLQKYGQDALMSNQDNTAKKIKLDDCMTTINDSNKELLDFLDQFDKDTPLPSQAKSVEEMLMQMEHDITNIRSCLEYKPKKLSLKDIDKKLDKILKILESDCWRILPESTAP